MTNASDYGIVCIMEGKNKLSAAYQTLQNQSLRGLDLKESDFFKAVLDNVDLTDSDLRGSDFRGAQLRRISITLDCRTFEDTKFDGTQVMQLLYLLMKANITDWMLNEITVDQLAKTIKGKSPVRVMDVVNALFTPDDKDKLDFYFKQVNP